MHPVILDKKCYVDPRICTAIPACPSQAMSYEEDDDLPLGGRIAVDMSRCRGCGVCADICCGDAIEMQDDPDAQ